MHKRSARSLHALICDVSPDYSPPSPRRLEASPLSSCYVEEEEGEEEGEEEWEVEGEEEWEEEWEEE